MNGGSREGRDGAAASAQRAEDAGSIHLSNRGVEGRGADDFERECT